MKPLFKDRSDAGRQLAEKLKDYIPATNVLVLGLPRGGVPVAFEIARSKQAPLDVFIVRKLGAPGQEELAMGALASGGIRVFNRQVIDSLQIEDNAVEEAIAREQKEIERRETLYRKGRATLSLSGRDVWLIDDGLATGSTLQAALMAIQQAEPLSLSAAVPVAAPDTCALFQEKGHEIVCLHTPSNFTSVGEWYENFSQTTDEDVRALLTQSL